MPESGRRTTASAARAPARSSTASAPTADLKRKERDGAPRGEGTAPHPGRTTIGLYNCYDPKRWHDIMRVTLARAAPVCLAFDCDLATFGFPFEQARGRGEKEHAGLKGAGDAVRFVAESTSIGEGGEALRDLHAAGRFRIHPFPGPAGWPTALGRLVATTPAPEAAKAVSPLKVAESAAAGKPHLLLFGLGPRGLPPEVLAQAPEHLEITGRRIALETATALGALPAMVAAHLEHLADRSRSQAPEATR